MKTFRIRLILLALVAMVLVSGCGGSGGGGPKDYPNLNKPANLSNSTVLDYLLHKASEGGIADLLGMDVLGIDVANVNISNGLGRVAAKAAAPLRGPMASHLGNADNPCDGHASGSVTVDCEPMFGNAYCSDASAIVITVACIANNPTSINLHMTGYGEALGTHLTGNVALTGTTMTFGDLTTDAGTTFDGSMDYAISNDHDTMTFTVNSITVNSDRWQNLVLDGDTHGEMLAVSNAGQNSWSMFLSGSGILKGTSPTVRQTMNLNCARSQDAIKSAGDWGGYDWMDNASVQLDGEMILNITGKMREKVQFDAFRVNEKRYYNGQTDDDYVEKIVNFEPGSKLASSRYGYAFFDSVDLLFLNNLISNSVDYESGTLTLSNSANL